MLPSEKKLVRIILNPNSGTRKKLDLPKLFNQHVNNRDFHFELHQTQSATHAYDLGAEAVHLGYDLVVAAGGDGTLNQVGRALVGTNIPLGILPLGSGNGFARALKIPLNLGKAIQLIQHGMIKRVDTGKANGHVFLNVCGFGFDAHVSARFATKGTRGFRTYAQISIMELAKYKPANYSVVMDGVQHEIQAFVMAVCNGPQYGSNAYIAPLAEFSDGMLDVTILKDVNWRNLSRITLGLFRRTLHRSNAYQGFRCHHMVVSGMHDTFVNIDGEAIPMEASVNIENIPNSLSVIVPPDEQ